MSPQIDICKSKARHSLLKSTLGFTLIEVLVSVIILAFGLVLVVEGMARTEQAFRISENMVTASLIAEAKIAESEIFVRDRGRLSSASDKSRESISGRNFEWDRRIHPFSHFSISDETNLNQADVTLEWKDGRVRENKQLFSTLILNPEKKK